jgi:hypothetical protein
MVTKLAFTNDLKAVFRFNVKIQRQARFSHVWGVFANFEP